MKHSIYAYASRDNIQAKNAILTTIRSYTACDAIEFVASEASIPDRGSHASEDREWVSRDSYREAYVAWFQ